MSQHSNVERSKSVAFVDQHLSVFQYKVQERGDVMIRPATEVHPVVSSC